MEQRSPTGPIGRVITGEETDPRQQQVAFLVPLVVLLGLLVWFMPSGSFNAATITGVAVAIVATTATFAVPWPRLPPSAVVAIPVLDLAVVGLLRLNPNAGAIGVLAVFPAMWLGSRFRSLGVTVVTLGSIAMLAVPSFWYYGFGLDGWSRAVILPLVAFVIAWSMSVNARVWTSQRAELEAQGAQIAQTLENLTEQRRLSDTMMRTVDVGLLTLGKDGAFTSMNPQHQQFIDAAYPAGHKGVAGQLGHAYAADATTPLTYDAMPTIRATRHETFSDYSVWVGADPAHRRALSVSARPMFDEQGDFGGAVLAYKDITDLMRALHVKDEFIASVSHELRTPLTSIIGYLDLVRDGEIQLPAEVIGYLDVAGRNAERLLLLVSDLLTTTLAEGGALDLRLEETDLGRAIGLSLAAAEPRARAAGVRLHGDLSDRTDRVDVPTVCADGARFGQVVDNLVSNAIKYTRFGGSVRVDLDVEGDEVVLTVADDGIGISVDDQEQLFTKFFRARTARENAIPGVGLGLVITKAIVEAHGGTIEASSEEGVGTTMRVRLPVISREARHVESVDRSA